MESKNEAAALVVQQDTTKDGVKQRLLKAAEDRKALPQSAKAMRLAVFRFLCDTLDVQDVDVRKAAWKQFDATPEWFGSNASAARQALGLQSDAAAVEAEFNA